MNFENYENKLPYSRKNENLEEYEAYRAEDKRLLEKFENDIYADLGIENNPKKEKLFSLAWSMGHSAGYSEVHGYACELVTLIED